MTRLFITALFAALLAIHAPLVVHAQAPVPTKAALFQTLAVCSDVESIYYQHKGKPVPLQASLSALSRLYETDASREISIFRLLPSKDPAIPPERQVLAKLSLAEGNPYLLLFTGNSDPAKVAVRAIEDSWDTHPENTFRIINFSRRTVAIRLGEEERTFQPGEHTVFKAAGKGYDYDFMAATFENGAWVLRIQSPQSILPRTRATMVIYDQTPTRDDPNPDDLNVSSFSDAQRITAP